MLILAFPCGSLNGTCWYSFTSSGRFKFNSTAYLSSPSSKEKKGTMFFWKQLRLHFAKKMCDVQQFRGSMMLIRTRIGLRSMTTAGMLLLYLSSFCRCAPHDFLILCFSLFWSSRGLKYPYMAKRLACMVISGAANADCLNILQPARLHQGTLIEVVAACLQIIPTSLSADNFHCTIIALNSLGS